MPRFKSIPIHRTGHRFEEGSTSQSSLESTINTAASPLINLVDNDEPDISTKNSRRKDLSVGTKLMLSKPNPAIYVLTGIYYVSSDYITDILISEDCFVFKSRCGGKKWLFNSSLYRMIKTAVKKESLCFDLEYSNSFGSFLLVYLSVIPGQVVPLPILQFSFSGYDNFLFQKISEFQRQSFLEQITQHNSIRNLGFDDVEKMKLTLKGLGLLPDLRPYQLKGVMWMNDRENLSLDLGLLPFKDSSSCSEDFIPFRTVSANGCLLMPTSPTKVDYWPSNGINISTLVGECLFLESFGDDMEKGDERPLTDDGVQYILDLVKQRRGDVQDQQLWYSLSSGSLVLGAPLGLATAIVRGGVLADEMGLGKTCQVMSLILLDKRRASKQLETKEVEKDPSEKLGFITPDAIARRSAAEPIEKMTERGDDEEEMEWDEGQGVGLGERPVEDRCMLHGRERMPTNRLSFEFEALDEDVGRLCSSRSKRPHKSDSLKIVDVGRDKMKKSGDDAENSCFCGRTFTRKWDAGWIQCDNCRRWCHVLCAGFDSERAAAKVPNFVCRVCICCELFENPLESESTLVVVPGSILGQWEGELQKHLRPGALRLYTYLGCSAVKRAAVSVPSRIQELDPNFLVAHDLVLTSFDVLAEELAQTDSPYVWADKAQSVKKMKFFDEVDVTAPRELRNPKKYAVVPSVLACIHWHRLILDEAQMIQGSATSATHMAMKLSSEVRWCVSGTPLGTGKLADLASIMRFLGQEPLDNSDCWRKLVGDGTTVLSHQILQAFCSRLFLRRTKDGVDKELLLPPQTEQKVLLQFSSVEAHFYRQLHDECLSLLRGVKEGNSEWEQKKLDTLVDKLLALRQACCHPQLGAKGVKSGRRVGRDGASSASVMTMDAILSRLLDATRVKCEEGQRLLLMALCGAAGVARILAAEHPEAAINRDERRVYLTTALKAYKEAFDLFSANRHECPLMGTVVLKGAEGFRADAMEVVARDVTLSWERSLPTSKQYFSPHESSEEMTASDLFGDDDALAVRMELGSGRRLTGVSVSPNLRLLWSLISEQRCGSRTTDCVVLFPKQLALYSGVGTGGMFAKVISGILESPLQALLADIGRWRDCEMGLPSFSQEVAIEDGHGGSHAIGPSGYRSRHWKVRVESVHMNALFLRAGSANIISLISLNSNPDSTNNSPSAHDIFLSMRILARETEFEVDTLQEFHILRNYSDVAAAALEDTDHESDTELSRLCAKDSIQHMRDRADNLGLQYLRAVKEVRALAKARFLESIGVSRARAEDQEDSGLWRTALLRALSLCRDPYLAQTLVFDIRKIVEDSEQAYKSIVQALPRECSGLLVVFGSLQRSLVTARAKAIHGIIELSDDPTMRQISQSGDCQRCRSYLFRTGPVCDHCRLEDSVTDYENTLYAFRRQSKRSEDVATTDLFMDDSFHIGDITKGNFQMDGPLLQFSNILVRFAAKNESEIRVMCPELDFVWMMESAKKEIERLVVWQRELVPMRSFWRQHLQLLSAHDELQMAVEPLRSVSAESFVPNGERASVVLKGEEQSRLADYDQECVAAKAELDVRLGQLRYLKNIDNERLVDKNAASCSICMESFADSSGEVCVIPCGHSFHRECINFILKHQSTDTSLKCPICRVSSPRAALVTVASPEARQNGPLTPTAVHRVGPSRRTVSSGQFGTKVGALVEDLKALPAGDKAVVFSHWAQMLDIVGAALAHHGIRYERFDGGKSQAGTGNRALSRFRLNSEVRALLLPFRSGARGLTLVEANHVFLLEPLLSEETEVQAINRVHRIGQTKPSVVHKYIMAETVEEKISLLWAQNESPRSDEASTSLRRKKSQKRRAGDGDGDSGTLSIDALKTLL